MNFLHKADAMRSEGVRGEGGGEPARHHEESDAGQPRVFVVDALGGLVPVNVPEPSQGVIHEREREQQLGGIDQERKPMLRLRVRTHINPSLGRKRTICNFFFFK